MARVRFALGAGVLGVMVCASGARAQFELLLQFDPGPALVGLGYSAATDTVWVYESSGALLKQYSREGVFLGSIARPGEVADDADVEFSPVDLTLGETQVTAGTILFINGESGTADIYAVDPATGTVLATLVTAFGARHVVGGTYHPSRGTFFLVQDIQPGGSAANRIAEVNAATGAIINSFVVSDVLPGYQVNYGDVEVAANGNLFVVSNLETTVLEMTPEGVFVGERSLPAGANSLSGVGIDDARCETWVASTPGMISRLGLPAGDSACAPPPCDPDLNCDGSPDQGDVACMILAVAGDLSCICQDPDFNQDGSADQGDVAAIIGVVAGQPCP